MDADKYIACPCMAVLLVKVKEIEEERKMRGISEPSKREDTFYECIAILKEMKERRN